MYLRHFNLALLLIGCLIFIGFECPDPIPTPQTTYPIVPIPSNAVMLQINPLLQETPVWCWLAVGEMVFRYYGVPSINTQNFQCGIIAGYFGPNSSCWYNCATCIVPGGSAQQVQDMLIRYPQIARSFYQNPSSPLLSVEYQHRTLTYLEIKNQIDQGKPLIVGISPSGYQGYTSAHVALVIGYVQTEQQLKLIINDPFPLHLPPFNQYPNAYQTGGADNYGGGRYGIEYSRLVSNLIWQESFFNISRIQSSASIPKLSDFLWDD